ncbi:MAG: cytochrome c biogenesis protein CcsA [Acidobacteria bacterium]|nr:cytochrome c biogenesis protein CcsA [Acidobacteriota bacterium]
MKNKFTIFATLTFALMAYGLYQALAVAPTERTMGDVQRIFYIHVPSAWIGGLCLAVNFLASLVYLLQRNQPLGRKADALAVASAEVGVICATVVLVTGPIWAHKAWGVWWAWDLRLTTTLVLWLIYLAYLMLRRFSPAGNAPLLAAVLAVFSFADVPFVWFAIRFREYRGNHPKPVFGSEPGQGLHPAMLKAFLINLLSFTLFGILLVAVRYTLERARQELQERRLRIALDPEIRAAQEVTR